MGQHPYSPSSLLLLDFQPALLSQEFILGVYGTFSIALFASLWTYSAKYKYLSTVERLLLFWFAFSGLTHIILEGYFAFTPEFFKLKSTNFFAEVWKEYSKADSRYVGRDTTIVFIEGMTAVLVGPPCLLAVYAILTRKLYQHALLLVISLAQLYGDIVYFGTALLEGTQFAAPGPVYFWFYFIFLNSLWIVFPFLICVRSWFYISNAFATKKKV